MMKIDYETIKAGDRVQIADGAWFTVERWCVNPDDLAIRTYCGQVCLAYAQRLITAHQPAEAKTEAEGLTNPTPAHEAQPVGEWVTYQKKHGQPMTPWHEGFNMDRVSVSGADRKNGSPQLGDMIARNPKNHNDMWLVAAQFFKDNYEVAPIIRTYNGEPASEWELEEESSVWWWYQTGDYWSACRYSGLAKGDRWMMQPPAPKPTTEE